jgi:hypothetical protein
MGVCPLLFFRIPCMTIPQSYTCRCLGTSIRFAKSGSSLNNLLFLIILRLIVAERQNLDEGINLQLNFNSNPNKTAHLMSFENTFAS